MSLALLVYLVGVITELKTLLAVSLFIGGVFCVGGYIGSLIYESDHCEKPVEFRNLLTKVVICWCVAMVVSVFTPSKETMVLMASAEIGQQMIQSEAVNTVVDPSVKLLRAWIEKETREIQNSTVEKK